jgi:hypothetical protein
MSTKQVSAFYQAEARIMDFNRRSYYRNMMRIRDIAVVNLTRAL